MISPEQLEPRRDDGIIARVWRAITNATPDMGPQPAERDTSETGRVDAAGQASYRSIYTLSARTRKAVYADADEMDQNAAEVSVALDTIADNVCASEDGEQTSFDVECEDAGALKVIQDTIDRAELHDKAYSLTRNTVKYGDSFSELVINGNLEITDLRQLPPITMYRNEDDSGNLVLGEPRFEQDRGGGLRCLNALGECAFEQHDSLSDHLTATFFPWQIVHTRLFHDGFSPYGQSLLRDTRVIWRKLKALEEGMIVGRLTRAYLKLIIYADGTGKSPQEKLKLLQELQKEIASTSQYVDQKREKPYSVLQDIYLTKDYVRGHDGKSMESLTKIDLIDPRNEGLQQIADIEYFHKQLLSTLRVPPAYMGFEADINAKATLSNEDVQYTRFVRRIQGVVSGTLKQCFDTALLLKGYDPDAVEYEITWPELSVEDEAASANSNWLQAQADDVYLSAGVVDKTWLQKHRFEMTDEEIAAVEPPAPEPVPSIPPALPREPVKAERVGEKLDAVAVALQRLAENGNGHKPEVHIHNVTAEAPVAPA